MVLSCAVAGPAIATGKAALAEALRCRNWRRLRERAGEGLLDRLQLAMTVSAATTQACMTASSKYKYMAGNICCDPVRRQ
jgi:hypothetical protein